MLLIEAVTLVSGALVTIVLGTPLAVRLARPAGLRKCAAPDNIGGMRSHARTAPFEPIDLGPDQMEWPSERNDEWPDLQPPPWPSASWDDEHFGKSARAALVPATPQVEGAEARVRPTCRSHQADHALHRLDASRVASPSPRHTDLATRELDGRSGSAPRPATESCRAGVHGGAERTGRHREGHHGADWLGLSAGRTAPGTHPIKLRKRRHHERMG